VRQQARTEAASRWVAGASALGALGVLTASAIGLAAPPTADSTTYLEPLQTRYVYLSESQLMSAGH
jgi:hypothetical protein